MNTKEVALSNGYIVTVIEKSETILDEIWKNKYYEKKFTIQAGMNVLDIGANQGFFSLYSACKGAKVFAYEPEQTNYNILHKNIMDNDLNDVIQCSRHAVGKKTGNIDIFMKDYEVPFASGMVTTSKEYLTELFNESSDTSFISKQTVPCLTLDTILETIKIDSIDLLKIDCEGAEVEILSGINFANAKKVRNIVMETHNTYPFSEIYLKVQDLGFSVEYFEKPNGVFKTGYIFASNNRNNTKDTRPIAIFNIPHFAYKNDVVKIDATQSFSTVNQTDLKYLWSINSKSEEQTQSPIIDHSFDSTGPQHILLEVVDVNNMSDSVQQYLWVFDKDYAKRNLYSEMPERGVSQEYCIKNSMSFKISAKRFPDFWMPDKIVIGIVIKDSKQTPLEFHFNGEKTIIDQGYIEKEFHNFPSEMDVNFSFSSEEERIIEIKWWWIKKPEKRMLTKDENGCCTLGEMSSEIICDIDFEKRFRIPQDAYPDSWTPKKLKFGVAAIPNEAINTELDGCFIVNKKRDPLTGWYTEIGVSDFNPDSDFECKIECPEKRKVKLVWWAE